MTEKHSLKDISKATRICITCIALSDGNNSNGTSSDITMDSIQSIEKEIELSSQQLDYIRKNYSELSRGVREIVHACSVVADEYTVFGVVRCKSSIANCEGAREAVVDIGKRFDMEEREVMADATENVKF